MTNIAGISVGWVAQKRAADGTAWLYAAQRNWGHTLIGVLWGAFMWRLEPTLFWWFTPVLAGMIFSIPLSVLTSRRSLGLRARSLGIFLTPEETKPPVEIDFVAFAAANPRTDRRQNAAAHTCRAGRSRARSLRQRHPRFAAARKTNEPDLCRAVRQLGAGSDGVRALGEKLLAEGPEKLRPPERMSVMADQRVMVWLHQQAWLRPEEKLAPWWKAMIREFSQRDH